MLRSDIAPRRRHLRRSVAAVVAVPAVAVLLTGCGSGRHNQQYLEHTVSNGVSGSIQGLGIRDAFFTRPVSKGDTAVLLFSVYADDPDSATTLTEVSASSLAAGPAQLAKVTNGTPASASAVPIVWQQQPGANQIAAYFSSVSVPVLSSTYFNVTFTFENGLHTTLDVPVQQVGVADPNSTALPTVQPDKPYALNSALPGEAGEPSASATASTVSEGG